MRRDLLAECLDEGRQLYCAMVQETIRCREGFPAMDDAGFQGFDSRRQALLAEIQAFQLRLRALLDSSDQVAAAGGREALEEFAIFQDMFIQMMLENDAEIMAQAFSRMVGIRSELVLMERGRRALPGYRVRRPAAPGVIDQTA
jgi:hypothetical protein